MNLFLRILFKISIFAIAVLIILALLKFLLPIEFTSESDEEFFTGFVILGIPLAILLTLSGTIKRTDTLRDMGRKIFATIFAAMIPVAIPLAFALNFMCDWYTEEILFDHETDSSQKIVLRSYGCGATDSTPPDYGTFKIHYYTSHIIWVTAIDTLAIDKRIWMRRENTN